MNLIDNEKDAKVYSNFHHKNKGVVPVDVSTQGFSAICEKPTMVRFVALCSVYRKSPQAKKTVSMFVGRPTTGVGIGKTKPIYFEDEDRTLIYPTEPYLPTVYAEINETGGLTFMLAEDY